MLSCCANSNCAKPFLRLREGKLFLVETEGSNKAREPGTSEAQHHRLQPRQLERYWLCDQCAVEWTLIYDRNRGIALIPLPKRWPALTCFLPTRAGQPDAVKANAGFPGQMTQSLGGKCRTIFLVHCRVSHDGECHRFCGFRVA